MRTSTTTDHRAYCSGGLKLSLHADTSVMDLILAELLSLIEAGDIPLEIGNRLVRAIEAGAKLFTFESDCLPAPGADHCIITAQPTQAFAVFMSAVRAGDRDLGLIEQALCHLESSSLRDGAAS
jgi:hypothetical protein